jgi:hypothetical protein
MPRFFGSEAVRQNIPERGDAHQDDQAREDDFQCHGTAQIDVERLVSDAHRTAP